MTNQNLFDEVDDIVSGVDFTHSDFIQELCTHMRSKPFDEGFELDIFMNRFQAMIEHVHDLWWESFGDKWFGELTAGVQADPKYDSVTGVFEFEPFHETMSTFDWLMHMAKAEELIQNFLDMSTILTIEFERAIATIEDGWIVGLSGRNPREREAEMRAHEMDPHDPAAKVWRGIRACELHFQEYSRRLKVRLKALDRYQTLGKEAIRYKAALLPKMDMRWGRFQVGENSWGLMSNQLTDDEDDEDDTES